MSNNNILISGANVGSIRIGEPAEVIIRGGSIIKTSPVTKYMCGGGFVCIKTTDGTVYGDSKYFGLTNEAQTYLPVQSIEESLAKKYYSSVIDKGKEMRNLGDVSIFAIYKETEIGFVPAEIGELNSGDSIQIHCNKNADVTGEKHQILNIPCLVNADFLDNGTFVVETRSMVLFSNNIELDKCIGELYNSSISHSSLEAVDFDLDDNLCVER